MTSVTPLKTSAGGIVITHTEISNRKQAEEERLELSGRLIDMQEKERSRLARELHDDFNQRLAVLAIDLERAAQTISNSPPGISQRLHELWNRAREIGTDLHSLSHRLHSSTLESLGLVFGVSSLCGEFAEQQDIQVDFTHENIPRYLPPDIALCLFRVAQEGLRNVKRHSGSSRAEVRLDGTEQAILLSISDKGRGFDSRTSPARGGLGIRSMRERLRLLGGRFEIRSQPGEGTVIYVSVPLVVNPRHSSSGQAFPQDQEDTYAKL
jgi:signal transduction histidine kinase